MGSHQPIRKVVTPEIPDKLYFRIGDVARLCEVPAYVLRFWETEFPQLKPNKGGTGQRLYRKRDVEMALRIKSLLYDQGYTIPGARQVFKSEARVKDVTPAAAEEPVAGPHSLVGRSQAERPQPGVRSPSFESASDGLRQARLNAVREQMQELLRSLSAPVGAVLLTEDPVSSAQKNPPRSQQVQTLRPRLVSDGGDAGLTKAFARPVFRSSLFSRDDQPDLFPPPPAPSE